LITHYLFVECACESRTFVDAFPNVEALRNYVAGLSIAGSLDNGDYEQNESG